MPYHAVSTGRGNNEVHQKSVALGVEPTFALFLLFGFGLRRGLRLKNHGDDHKNGIGDPHPLFRWVVCNQVMISTDASKCKSAGAWPRKAFRCCLRCC